MTTEEMKVKITKEFEASLNSQKLEEYEISRAEFVCKDVLTHCANDEQIMDMYGFIVYCRSNSDKLKYSLACGSLDNYIRFNITHDIYEFFNNHNEDWFSPRTSGYRKYIDLEAKNKEATCRICGCTEQKACPGGCYWIEKDLCNQCRGKKSRKSS